MTGFGDIVDDDVWAPGDADPFAACVILYNEIVAITGDPIGRPRFEELPQLEQWVWIVAFARLLDRFRREGSR